MKQYTITSEIDECKEELKETRIRGDISYETYELIMEILDDLKGNIVRLFEKENEPESIYK